MAPGHSATLLRQFGPLDPHRGCMRVDPDLVKVRFVDDGLALDGAPVEASFELEREGR